MHLSFKRIVLLSVGWICVALGVIGIFLPLLPTTPFMLLASACFMRGSPRIAKWLHEHPKFGPALNNWHQHRAIDRRIKRRANVCIVASFCLSIAIVPAIWQKVMLLTMATILLIWFNRLREIEAVAHAPENT
ncbi:YbaN family protein [Enterovibrio sp. ZSDZ35]|uniref:Inner membrane protein n=1 Tax=Enterovibrio qingdaonensis TaxID=2899818 RepID=A0ABT5QN26_9GAMM|nr:YbaN family protein [Enterovibrio sp. ZSDZ35]MDD1782397.1 YbaN family protein [Enterovibrio sp. ZSDZ35]